MKKFTKVFTLFALALFTLSATGCLTKKLDEEDQAQLPLPDAQNFAGTSGIVHIRQIREYMSAVTGVSTTHSDVSGYYYSHRSLMSLDGNVESISSTMILAITGLAGVYCNQFILQEIKLPPAARAAHARVSFELDQRWLDPSIREDVARAYFSLFLLRAPEMAELQIVLTAMDEALLGAEIAPVTVRNTLLVGCTAVLSSLEFIQS